VICLASVKGIDKNFDFRNGNDIDQLDDIHSILFITATRYFDQPLPLIKSKKRVGKIL
jgi:hypothetical protein